MWSSFSRLTPFAAALALTACATATPYQPLKTSGLDSGGFSELKISSDRYRITFRGGPGASTEAPVQGQGAAY